MTIKTVKTVIERFLSNDKPEVLVLNGAWGIGKTYLWQKLVQQHKDEIKLPKYVYVSLFGISSLSELRVAIFAKTNLVETLDEKIDVNKPEIWFSWDYPKLLFYKLKELPYINKISTSLEVIAPYLIKDSVICFDDFERMSVNIKHDEFLGLITELKEERKCKIAIIFNKNELKNPEDYNKYCEKVVDQHLLFAPTSEEALELAIPVTLPYRDTIKKYAMLLDINNIRVLRKIVNLAELIHNEAHNFIPQVFEQAIMSLVLFVWCTYDSNEKKPTIDFIIKWNRLSLEDNDANNKNNEQKQVWSKILHDYGLMLIDEFDRTILKVIEYGYLEETGFIEEAKKLEAQFHNNEAEQSFSAAWDLFHYSFKDNTNEMIDVMTKAFKSAVKRIAPVNLNGMVVLFRQLDQNELANELIDYYIKDRENEEKLFNLSENIFSDDITDQVIRDCFEKKYSETQSGTSLAEAIKHIAENNGWSLKHIEALKNASENDFYTFFKLDHDKNLGKLVRSCLMFETIAEHNSIGQKVRSALILIGKENQLNSIRVKRYGITI